MKVRRAAFLFSGLAVLLATGCAGPAAHAGTSTDPAPRALRLRSDPASTLPSEIVVLAVVEDHAGRRHERNGVGARGGTVRALCASLCSSLARSTCEAVRRDGEVAEDPLRAAMHQVVVLPVGWRFVEVRMTAPDGAAAAWLTATLEPSTDR